MMKEYLLHYAKQRNLTLSDFDRDVRSLQLFTRKEELEITEKYRELLK